jgi:4-hydroxy-4-methyl-2-oxoglutarate aldolase
VSSNGSNGTNAIKYGERGRKLSAELIEQYQGVQPATIGHLPGTRLMTWALKPGYRNCKLVGQAFTVSSFGLDISTTSKACDLIEAGEVMVVDRGGDVENACIGEFRALAQQKKGIAGWVIDGASTDILECEAMKFPIFARTWSARVGHPANLGGLINLPVSCGGVTVHPGDLIVGDDNGVAVLSPDEAEALIDKCLEVEAREAERRLEYQPK